MTVNVETSAEGLLDFTWTDPDGTVRLPIDPVQIATSLGVRVFKAALDSDVSGSLVKNPGQDAVILLNRDDSNSRQRFTCAHELGHYVHRSGSGDEEFEYVEYRGPLATTGTDSSEVRANQFAAALLMPERLVRKHAARGVGPIELAQLFGVSADAMTYRMKNLQLI